jgi:hypothetical protein
MAIAVVPRKRPQHIVVNFLKYARIPSELERLAGIRNKLKEICLAVKSDEVANGHIVRFAVEVRNTDLHIQDMVEIFKGHGRSTPTLLTIHPSRIVSRIAAGQ